jgi:hypothetical protein
MKNPEKERVKTTTNNTGWKKWGPYLTERQWGTVREDYSEDGSAWDFLPHDHARSKAYRWGEEGIGGISDNKQNICFALALWNGKDPILKERMFGLTGAESNHGEDCKELYYYLDSTPTHSYMKMLYKYPQELFPYEKLKEGSRQKNQYEPEYEIMDTGVFDDNHYFDIYIEYAKASEEDILIKISAANRSTQRAFIQLLPTVWLRNTWEWNADHTKPQMKGRQGSSVQIDDFRLGNYFLYAEQAEELLFCDNETNQQRLYGTTPPYRYFKDGINDYVISGNKEAVNPEQEGTKASFSYRKEVEPGQTYTIRLRLSQHAQEHPFEGFEEIFNNRIQDSESFYEELQEGVEKPDLRQIQRQAYAGMLWTKQFYYFNVKQWLEGDPGQVTPPATRKYARNAAWKHMNNENIISMPDKWEYPWYAAWDLAFHTLPLARLDPHFAKRQLEILLREYYMHPNGQIPAYEWNFSDVNPPVHAWATLKVFEIDREMNGGTPDIEFLEKIFQKLLLNFTWWVNQKDSGGHNIFEGGFLGLDNIGVFDRSKPLPTGGIIEQADGTSWMAMFSLNMLKIALEISEHRPVYQDMASKFFEHFLHIAGALANIGDMETKLWNEEDEFFYDVLLLPDGTREPLKVRSMVGLTPLYAVEVLEPHYLEKLPVFKRRLEWVLNNRPDLASLISRWHEHGKGETKLLSLLRGHRMKKLYKRMLDETEFLSEYGVRALSKYHLEHPYEFWVNGELFKVTYTPGESESTMFGGNSNWRGPVWFPVNFLILDSMYKFHSYYGDDFKIEYPTNSGHMITIEEAANKISERLIGLFARNEKGERPVYGTCEKQQKDEHFKDLILFYEYFHGDSGRGIGASHQTGWTGLVAELIRACNKK